ncbi:caax amino terminal protease family protein [hydrocarbon metagenome]|uniref:Caax amino terminal protease family protein n=1 Tax=hydrocarbon metagenome TaxID=938273 RepID=A0A0W8E606_9ZZZZ
MKIDRKKVLLFLGLTFLFDWLLVGLFLGQGGTYDNTTPAMIMAVGYMFVPMLAALFVQKLIYREPVIQPLGISFKLNRWWLVAWLLPVVLAVTTLGVSILFPGVEFSSEMAGYYDKLEGMLTPDQMEAMQEQAANFPVHPFWIALLQGLIAGPTINAVAGFGEELGWRGFLLKELMPLGFWKSSLTIGAIWGIWHAPLILQGHNYPQHPIIGVFMMVIWCLLLSPIFSYIRLKAKSVIAAAVLHGSLNATAGLPIIMLVGGSDLTVGVTGFAGFIVLAAINLLIFWREKEPNLSC